MKELLKEDPLEQRAGELPEKVPSRGGSGLQPSDKEHLGCALCCAVLCFVLLL